MKKIKQFFLEGASPIQSKFICLRVGSRSPATFKTKLSVTTVNGSFQLLPIFCHKKLHLRCYIELALSIVTWSMKLLKDEGALPMITCNLGKTHSPRYPKNIFQDVFRIRLSFLHLYQMDYMKLSTRWHRL